MKKWTAILLCCVMMTCTFAAMGAAEAPEITLPYTGEEVHFTGYGPEGVKQNDATPLAKAWREKVGNIFIDWELAPSSDYKEKVKVYLAADNMPDVLPILDFKVTINEYGESGMFLDFSKYEQYMPNLQAYRKGEMGSFMDSILNAKGERLAIMGIQPNDFTGEGWQANKTLLDECGVAIPETAEEFFAAMKAVKAKRPDVVPFQSYWGQNYTMGWMASVVGANTSLVYYDAADQTWKCAYREPAAKRKELIETMAMCYKEGLINPEIATMSGEQEDQQLTSGKWAFYAGYNGSVRGYFKADDADGANPMPFEVVTMLPPKASDNTSYLRIAYIHDAIPGWGFVCSSKAKNPEYLAAYMDTVVSPFGKDLWNYGVEGVTYDVVDGEKVVRDNIDRDVTGWYSQYEIWTVGMGSEERYTTKTEEFYKNMWNMNRKAFDSGEMKADYQKGIPIFTPEAGAERSSLENDLNTYIAEEEAKFIYGDRPIAEWDNFVADIEKYVDIDALLTLYKEARTIDISGPRIWQDYLK